MSPSNEGRNRLEIGSTLRDARQRLGLDIREVEEQTKIRARYLRALENEDWEALPAPAYVRGFLRSYGQVLGLDGEMLADEHRRRHEAPEGVRRPGAEGVLSEPRRPGESPPSRWPIVVAALLGLVVVLVVIGLIGGDDGDDERRTPQERREQRQKQQKQRANQQASKRDSKPPTLKRKDITVEALSEVDLCLAAGGEALIDRQVLPAGAAETHGGSKRYRLDVVGGGVRVRIGKERRKVETAGVASVEADSRGIRPIEYAGPDCP